MLSALLFVACLTPQIIFIPLVSALSMFPRFLTKGFIRLYLVRETLEIILGIILGIIFLVFPRRSFSASFSQLLLIFTPFLSTTTSI